MKKSLIVTSILLSIMSFNYGFASTKISKTFDGGVAVCESKSDVGQRAYRLHFISETGTAKTKEIALKLDVLKCAETANGYKLLATNLSELTEKYFVNEKNELVTIKSKLDSLSLYAFTQDSKFLGQGRIVEDENKKLVVRFSLSDKFIKQAIILIGFVESTPDFVDSEAIELKGGGFILNF